MLFVTDDVVHEDSVSDSDGEDDMVVDKDADTVPLLTRLTEERPVRLVDAVKHREGEPLTLRDADAVVQWDGVTEIVDDSDTVTESDGETECVVVRDDEPLTETESDAVCESDAELQLEADAEALGTRLTEDSPVGLDDADGH